VGREIGGIRLTVAARYPKMRSEHDIGRADGIEEGARNGRQSARVDGASVHATLPGTAHTQFAKAWT